eukprot:6593416-Pyramimonas_sp.AAC.1
MHGQLPTRFKHGGWAHTVAGQALDASFSIWKTHALSRSPTRSPSSPASSRIRTSGFNSTALWQLRSCLSGTASGTQRIQIWSMYTALRVIPDFATACIDWIKHDQ